MREVEGQVPSSEVPESTEREVSSEAGAKMLSDQDLDDVAGASTGRKNYPPYL